MSDTEKIFNVKDYGAFGDGRDDDRKAIRLATAAALEWGKETGGQAVVYFPPGVYQMDTNTDPRVEYRGEGEPTQDA